MRRLLTFLSILGLAALCGGCLFPHHSPVTKALKKRHKAHMDALRGGD